MSSISNNNSSQIRPDFQSYLIRHDPEVIRKGNLEELIAEACSKLEQLTQQLAKKAINLSCNNKTEILTYLANKSFPCKQHLKANFREEIEDLIAEYRLEHKEIFKIFLELKDEKISISDNSVCKFID